MGRSYAGNLFPNMLVLYIYLLLIIIIVIITIMATAAFCHVSLNIQFEAAHSAKVLDHVHLGLEDTAFWRESVAWGLAMV